ncbi:MAG: choice-of-anchor J domain-containing protein [Bacteroidota bacterium]|nr:choice-of-anchor J domain-containing protein [Bacteroidota bacterium]
MQRKSFTFSTVILLSLGILFGFSIYNGRPTDNNPYGSKSKKPISKIEIKNKNNKKWESDNTGGSNNTLGIPYYIDNFNGANDTTSLKNRGYKVYYRGSGPQGISPTWFQGNAVDLFPALNGPDSGYVAANYQVVTGLNDIDSWLVLPKKNITATDQLVFFTRSPLLSTYPDSIRVMYSAAGDSTPENSWIELGKFKTITNGSWERKAFSATSSGVNARFAIRYKVADGGPSGDNSDYIGIDSLSIETTFTADVAATSINNPSGNISLPTSTIAPKATFKNEGTVIQANIPVTFKITGPVNYTSNKTITSLGAGASINVTFDSIFLPVQGTYNISVYSRLLADQNRNNDTLKKTIRALIPNYGKDAGYYYSNSIASGVVKPQFCWKDTTGSRSLIVNKNLIASNIFTGDVDDGYFRLGNVLGSGKKIRFGGADYDSVFIGTNGLIGFSIDGNTDFTNFSPDTGFVEAPAFYPLWMDLNYNNPAASINRLSYKVIDGFQLLITYDRAPIFDAASNEYISFQVVIDVVESSYPSNSRLLVQFADTSGSKTGSGFLTKYNLNTLPTLATGLASSQSNKVFYRFSSGGNIIYPGPLFGTSSIAVQFGPDSSKINNSCAGATLNLTASLESITPLPFPSSHTSDTIIVLLREITSPFEIADGDKKVLNANGISTLSFSKIVIGKNYYVVVKHRNSLETWSKFGLFIASSNVSYDFTTGLSKAFGDNMTTVNGEASIYAGDVNQDGVVDLSDGSLVDNGIFNFSSGYVSADVNNDSVVDISDAAYVDNNAFNFVSLQRP